MDDCLKRQILNDPPGEPADFPLGPILRVSNFDTDEIIPPSAFVHSSPSSLQALEYAIPSVPCSPYQSVLQSLQKRHAFFHLNHPKVLQIRPQAGRNLRNIVCS